MGIDVDLNEGPRRDLLPRGKTLLALIAALCFLTGALGWNLGKGRPPGRSSADVGFLFDMVAHHQQAVAMSRSQLFYGTAPEVDHFAEEILRWQSYEIGLMDRMLDEWGYAIEDPPETAMAWMGHEGMAPESMPGMASEAEMELLRTGPDTDASFLALMADHHAGGVAMAAAAVQQVDDREVRELAERILASQRMEIRELVFTRKQLDLPTEPAGVEVTLFDVETAAIVDAALMDRG